IRGMGAPDVGLCCDRAESLARSLNCFPSFYSLLAGQWRQSLSTGKLSATLQIAKRLYALAQEQNDSLRLTGACASLACTTSLFGRFRGFRAIRDPWRSVLALTKHTGLRTT